MMAKLNTGSQDSLGTLNSSSMPTRLYRSALADSLIFCLCACIVNELFLKLGD